MKNYVASDTGMTLVELLIAISIFAVGLLGVAGMQVTGMMYNRESNVRTVAAAAAQAKMEEILAMPSPPAGGFPADALFAAPGPNTGFTPYSVNVGSATMDFTIVHRVVLDTPLEDMARIDLGVVVTGTTEAVVTTSAFWSDR